MLIPIIKTLNAYWFDYRTKQATELCSTGICWFHEISLEDIALFLVLL